LKGREKKREVKERDDAYRETVVAINRVAKVVKGGRRFGFTAVVVVGDGNGKVGYGLGKAGEVAEAIRKGVASAKKEMVDFPRKGTTLPYQVSGRYGGASVVLKPASEGTGVIAGSVVRAVMDASGISDVLTKSLGSTNPTNLVKATFKAVLDMRVMHERVRLRSAEG
jgi:small subunit ribosomal protein S5